MAQEENETFPWNIGLYDAHCHPTDTLSALPDIEHMRARGLTVMATRFQDQELVQKLVDSNTRTEAAKEDSSDTTKVIPCFGHHPWFSHQLYLDEPATGASDLTLDEIRQHYMSVLAPSPADDKSFLSSLPRPLPLSIHLARLRERLLAHPTALVGEVGLDRGFRLPAPWTASEHAERDSSLTEGGREGRRLSPYKVKMEHQVRVLQAQLRLAGELSRAVSVHGVQCHGALFEALRELWKGREVEVESRRARKRKDVAATDKVTHAGKSPVDIKQDSSIDEDPDEGSQSQSFPPRICLHSFSGPPELVKQYLAPSIPAEMFFSFSTVINFPAAGDRPAHDGGDTKAEAAIKAVPAENILVESDLHTAGPRMDALLEDMARRICRIKGWTLEAGVKQLGQNWRRFIHGSIEAADGLTHLTG